MSKRTFNRLQLEFPDGWEDQTIITMLAPPETAHAAPLTGMRPDEHRASIVVKRFALEDEMTPEEVAESYEHIHLHTMKGGRVVGRDTLDLPTGKAAIRKYEIPGPEGVVRQIHVHVDVGGESYVLFGTASADLNFAKLEKTTIEVAKSLQLSG